MLRSLVPSSRLIRLVAMFSVSNIFMRNGELGLRIDHRRQFIDDLVQGERVSIGHHNGQDEGRQDVVVAAIHCASLAGSIWKFQKNKIQNARAQFGIFDLCARANLWHLGWHDHRGLLWMYICMYCMYVYVCTLLVGFFQWSCAVAGWGGISIGKVSLVSWSPSILFHPLLLPSTPMLCCIFGCDTSISRNRMVHGVVGGGLQICKFRMQITRKSCSVDNKKTRLLDNRYSAGSVNEKF